MPRWVLAIVIILVLIGLDRAYMGGQNAALLMLAAHRTADLAADLARDVTRKVLP
jgi:hypothetical protein